MTGRDGVRVGSGGFGMGSMRLGEVGRIWGIVG